MAVSIVASLQIYAAIASAVKLRELIRHARVTSCIVVCNRKWGDDEGIRLARECCLAHILELVDDDSPSMVNLSLEFSGPGINAIEASLKTVPGIEDYYFEPPSWMPLATDTVDFH